MQQKTLEINFQKESNKIRRLLIDSNGNKRRELTIGLIKGYISKDMNYNDILRLFIKYNSRKTFNEYYNIALDEVVNWRAKKKIESQPQNVKA